MLTRPKWSAACDVAILDDQTLVAISETSQNAFKGAVYPLLAPLLDGTRTASDLIGELSGKVMPPYVFYAIHLLEQKGCLVESGDGASLAPEDAAFWNALGIDGATAQARLESARVRVDAVGGVDPAAMIEALGEAGIGVEPEGGVRLVLTDHYLDTALEDINRAQLAAGQPWMLAKPVGTVLWLGPVFVPGRTACWECLASRMRVNQMLESFAVDRCRLDRPLPRSLARSPVLHRTACRLAALELAKLLAAGEARALAGEIVTLDLVRLQTERHTVARRPQCAVCGDPQHAARGAEPPVLQSRPLGFTAKGERAAYPPAEITLRRYRHLVSPISGAVMRLTPIEEHGENGLSYGYGAVHGFPNRPASIETVMTNLVGRSGGKGASELQAKVSAFCEGIERYSAVYQGDEPVHQAMLAELGDQAIPPNALTQFSDAQFDDRDAWNRREVSVRNRVPERLDDHFTIDWTRVWSLSGGGFRYVPAAYCWYGHPDLQSYFFCSCDSNGSAAGNSLEEAILGGFLELFERDAVGIWWFNQTRQPGVDLDSFRDPFFDQVREYYDAVLNRDLWVLDVGNDLGMPTFAAISRRRDRGIEDILLGFAASPSPRRAVFHALCEINQSLPKVAREDREGRTLYWSVDPEAVQWWKTATVAELPYLLPDPAVPARRCETYRSSSAGDLLEEIQTCIDTVEARGMRAYVLDQTRPDIGLSVAKVFVPGLCHFWKRFGARRLYDVPVTLGRRDAPCPEPALNRYGIYF